MVHTFDLTWRSSIFFFVESEPLEPPLCKVTMYRLFENDDIHFTDTHGANLWHHLMQWELGNIPFLFFLYSFILVLLSHIVHIFASPDAVGPWKHLQNQQECSLSQKQKFWKVRLYLLDKTHDAETLSSLAWGHPFSKVLYVWVSYSTYTRALTFEVVPTGAEFVLS